MLFSWESEASIRIKSGRRVRLSMSSSRLLTVFRHLKPTQPALNAQVYQIRRMSAQLPSTIQAITVPKHGDFDVIELTEQPFPKQAGNEIVVKVIAVQLHSFQFFF